MRYLPLTPDDRVDMLAAIGAGSIDDLFVDVPAPARREGFVDLPHVAGELEVEREMAALAGRNVAAGSAVRVPDPGRLADGHGGRQRLAL